MTQRLSQLEQLCERAEQQSHVFGIGVVASPEVDLLAAVTSLRVSRREPFILLQRPGAIIAVE